MHNPFAYITPRENEKIIDRVGVYKGLESKILETLEKGNIILLEGDYGSGKSLLVQKLNANLKEKIKIINLNFTGIILNDLRKLPLEKKREILVIIDSFDFIKSLNENDFKKVLDLIIELKNRGLSFLLLINKQTIKMIEKVSRRFKKESYVISIPPLDYRFSRELILSRLNEVKDKKGSSILFSEKEMKEIWRNSRGNPRMLLLLCENLFERKIKEA